MLRAVCAIFVVALAVDAVFGSFISQGDRDKLTSLVVDKKGSSSGDEDRQMDANALAEQCNVGTVQGANGVGVFSGSVDAAASSLANAITGDPESISCDGFKCPDGNFYTCAYQDVEFK